MHDSNLHSASTLPRQERNKPTRVTPDKIFPGFVEAKSISTTRCAQEPNVENSQDHTQPECNRNEEELGGNWPSLKDSLTIAGFL